VADLGEFGRELADLDDEVDVFTFHGEFFALPARMSALPLLRFAWRGKVLEQRVAQAKSARARAQTDEDRLAADQAEGTADMDALSAIYEFLQASLPDDWDRFERVAIRAGADQDELLEVCNRIYAAVSGRPTRRPAGSSGGPSTSGDGSTAGPGWQESPAFASQPDPVPALPERSLRDQQRAAYLQGMRPVGASPR
jgi:hypothetical protein